MILSRVWLSIWLFRLTKLHSLIFRLILRRPVTQKYRPLTKFPVCEPGISQVSQRSKSHIKAFTQVLDSGILIHVYNPFGRPHSLYFSYSSANTVQDCDFNSLIYLPAQVPSLVDCVQICVSRFSTSFLTLSLKFLLGYPSIILNSTRTKFLDLSLLQFC